ncbi:MAG TPA: hypothetical protein VLE99_06865 [Candidatus Saccharimonadales bacterium]|nr:hypothetical protein [Candidatus Saccharimonadales bacterium]
MSNTASTQSLPKRVQDSLDRLQAAGEVGQFLVPTYLAAYHLEPEILQLVVLLPHDVQKSNHFANGKTPGHAVLPASSAGGGFEVYVDTTSWERYAQLLKDRHITIEEIARKLGITAAEVTPPMFAVFTLAHELGHMVHFAREGLGFDHELIGEQYRGELQMLPYPGKSAAGVIDWARKNPAAAEAYLVQEHDRLAGLGIHSVEELLIAQERAYRNMPFEDSADQFGVHVIRSMQAPENAPE